MDRDCIGYRTRSLPPLVVMVLTGALAGALSVGCGSRSADAGGTGGPDVTAPPEERPEVQFWQPRDTVTPRDVPDARVADAADVTRDAGRPDAHAETLPPAPDVHAADAGGPPADVPQPPPVDVREFEREVILFGPGTPQPFVPTADNSEIVALDPNGNLTLSQTHETIRFIWIANSAEGTVSRLDTETGAEVGRYRVCTDPSRTSVDLDGNVWVACRGDGSVSKILQDTSRCPDRDGDGVETARDTNGDGRVDPNTEMLPQGTDECVLFTVAPYGSGSIGRALAVDQDNYAWAGFWNAQKLARLDPDTGAVVQEISPPGRPYGFAIDRRGILWVSFREWSGGGGSGALGRVDPATGSVEGFVPGGCLSLYGITVDRLGRVWLGNYSCSDVLVFDPSAAPPVFQRVALSGYTRGVAASREGHVCVAHSDGSCSGAASNNQVTCIDDQTLVPTVIPLGGDGMPRGPVGVAFAADGRLWAVNQCASSATRIDTIDRLVLGEHPVGQGPYTYSDMTGYSLRTQVDPEGWYQVHARVSDPKFTGWYRLTVEATTPPGSALYLQLRSYRDGDDPEAAAWSPRFGPFPPEAFPFALHTPAVSPYARWGNLDVRVFLTRDEGAPPIVHRVALEYR